MQFYLICFQIFKQSFYFMVLLVLCYLNLNQRQASFCCSLKVYDTFSSKHRGRQPFWSWELAPEERILMVCTQLSFSESLYSLTMLHSFASWVSPPMFRPSCNPNGQFLTSWETQNVIIWRDWNETEKSTFLKNRSFDANDTHWLASHFCFLYQQHYLLSSTAVSCGGSLLLIVYLIKTNVHGTTS